MSSATTSSGPTGTLGDHIALSELREGSSGPVIVMVCRQWDVTNVNGRYMSTDYVVTDIKGGVMHCTARNNIAHYFFDKLKEGVVYSLRGFTVQKAEMYRIFKDIPYVLNLTGSTTVKQVSVSSGPFNRHPFLLSAYEDLQPTDGKYFVDVVGYVTEVGPQFVKASGARTVEFDLINERNRRLRVTLWGDLGDVMLKKKEENPAVYTVILTSMSAKLYLGALGLSSSTSTMIIDSPDVPALQDFTSKISCVSVGGTTTPIVEDIVRVNTLQELVDRVREDKSKKKAIVFRNTVEITAVRTKNSWYLFACSGTNCRKGLTREGGSFVCKTCKSKVDYPRTRFRIQTDVTDGTMSAVVVLFDEVAEQLLKRTAKSLVDEQATDDSMDAPPLPPLIESLIGTKHTFEIKSSTYYRYGDYESFNCAKVVSPSVEDHPSTGATGVPELVTPPNTSFKRTSPALASSPKTGRKLRKLFIVESDDEDDAVPDTAAEATEDLSDPTDVE